METVSSDFRAAETAYGRNVFDLVLAKGYLGKLLRNSEVSAFLVRCFPEMHEGFRTLVDETSLDVRTSP